MELIPLNKNLRNASFHVAVIMDGNGRWALRQGLPRIAGHKIGAETARKIVEHATELNVDVLTLYAFSSDNWKRPDNEVRFLMRLLRRYIKQEIKTCLDNNIRMAFIGRRDRLDDSLRRMMETAERKTEHCDRLYLRVAIDYSARDILFRAAQLNRNGDLDDRDDFKKYISEAQNEKIISSDVDLLIRTGGEQRLSDFLLWECAYAEFYFSEVMWPDFSKNEFEQAVDSFRQRERRFGTVRQQRPLVAAATV